MFINVGLQSQQMRKRVKNNEGVVLTNMVIAKHDFLGRSLRRLKLILRLDGALNIKK